MSRIRIEYTNAEGDCFEVNMETEEIPVRSFSAEDNFVQAVLNDRDIIAEAVAAIKRAACITSR